MVEMSVASQEGILKFDPQLLPMRRISPSRVVLMRECPLREVLVANGLPKLLPSSPSARLGSAIHAFLEEVGRKEDKIIAKDLLELTWDRVLGEMEVLIAGNWLERHFVPLRRSVPDFEVRRIQAMALAEKMPHRASSAPWTPADGRHQARFGPEIPVSSSDGLISARLDSVVSSDGGVIIRDYKSGSLYESPWESNSPVRLSYEVQLKVYAALYFDAFGVWPFQLELVPLSGVATIVACDPDECRRLVDDARLLFMAVNHIIGEATARFSGVQWRLARPAPRVCASCEYRPACGPYRQGGVPEVEEGGSPRDAWGRIQAMQRLGNGSFAMSVTADHGLVHIRGLSGDARRHPALSACSPGDPVSFFGMRAAGSDGLFTESPMTTVYREPAASDQDTVKD